MRIYDMRAKSDTYCVVWIYLYSRKRNSERSKAIDGKYQCRKTPFLGPDVIDLLFKRYQVLVAV
jgi:hypothetical protein